MRIEIAALCDAATEQAGRLNLLGAFDQLQANQFPFVLPACTIVFRIRFNRAETGEQKLKLNFKNAEGQKILPEMEASLPIKLREGEDSRVGNLILNVHGIKFEGPGYYSVDLAFNGAHVISLPVQIFGPAAPYRQ